MPVYFRGLIFIALAGVVGVTGVTVPGCKKRAKKLDWVHLALFPVDDHRAVLLDSARDTQTSRYRISLMDMRRGLVWSRSLPGEPYWLGANHCTSVGQGVISTRVRINWQQAVVGYDLERGKKLWESERLPAENVQGARLSSFLTLCNLSGKTRTFEAFRRRDGTGMDLLALDRRTGKTVWKQTWESGPSFGGSVAAGEVVIVRGDRVGKVDTRFSYLRKSDGQRVHLDRQRSPRQPCLAFNQSWFLTKGRTLTALDLTTLKRRQVTPDFGATADGKARVQAIDSCAEAKGRLIAIGSDFAGSTLDAPSPKIKVLAINPQTGAVDWMIDAGRAVDVQFSAVMGGATYRAREPWTGKLPRYVPLSLRPPGKGGGLYQIALMDVHHGRQQWRSPKDKALLAYLPVTHGNHTLFAHSNGNIALFDGNKGALVRALHGAHAQLDRFRPFHLQGGSLWLWDRLGIQVLDLRSLKVRYTRGKWTPLTDSTAQQRKRFSAGPS